MPGLYWMKERLSNRNGKNISLLIILLLLAACSSSPDKNTSNVVFISEKQGYSSS